MQRDSTTGWVIEAVRRGGWAPLGVFLAHILVSRGLGLYREVPHLDVPMHLAGGVAIAYFFARAVELEVGRVVVGALTPYGAGLLTLALTCTAAVGWELAEWTSDALGWTSAQAGNDDTMLDMLLGVVGGAALVALRRR